MEIHLLTALPAVFLGFLENGIIGKAIQAKLLSITVVDIRAFAAPPHYRLDDKPYGGGPGMVMLAEPIFQAIEASKKQIPDAPVVYLSPSGMPHTQERATRFSEISSLIFLCGRYEGVDQRVIDSMVDYEVSIGDYVLMGGEVAAMVVIESVVRLLPHVLGNGSSTAEESFMVVGDEQLLEGPHYTKPREIRGVTVPEVLLSGDHAKIAAWRYHQARLKTERNRPDLLLNRHKEVTS
jgi:tRNA (guanine37-N1)-methyltransferase